MKILKITARNIRFAGNILKSGGVVVYPTDTAYALGGIFNSKKVIQKILKIKRRKNKKFTLIASDIRQVEKFFHLSSFQKKLAKRYWPGPLSLVVSKKYAVRVPKNSCARKLARVARSPLIASSANISGAKTSYSISVIVEQFKDKKIFFDLILDAGVLPKKLPSTIVRVFRKDTIEIVREGSVRSSKIAEFIMNTRN